MGTDQDFVQDQDLIPKTAALPTLPVSVGDALKDPWRPTDKGPRRGTLPEERNGVPLPGTNGVGLTGHPDRLVLPRIMRQAWQILTSRSEAGRSIEGKSVNTRLSLVVPAFSEERAAWSRLGTTSGN